MTAICAILFLATDGEHVVYIGSLGLLCYDFAGREVWRRRLATPKTIDEVEKVGSGTSPVVAACYAQDDAGREHHPSLPASFC